MKNISEWLLFSFYVRYLALVGYYPYNKQNLLLKIALPRSAQCHVKLPKARKMNLHINDTLMEKQRLSTFRSDFKKNSVGFHNQTFFFKFQKPKFFSRVVNNLMNIERVRLLFVLEWKLPCHQNDQKQPPELFCKKRYSKKNRDRKTSVLEHLQKKCF